LLASTQIGPETRKRIQARAIDLVQRIRNDSSPGMMELFLGEYGLSSDEGIALMCLAEALLRVPDGETMDALIEDKIAPSAWGQHLGKSNSSLVNASTWALFVTGKVLQEDQGNSIASILHSAIKRLGEPVIRQAVSRAMKEMGRQFVLGETIESAMERAGDMEEMGFTYSYDMLGEAARTEKDAHRYHLAYSEAISEIAKAAKSDDIRENPGISIKLSALHPRYETLQKQSVMDELVPRARSLAVLAKSAGIGLNIDAEEAGRLDLSLQVIETILQDPVFAGWDGFGVVVQAYGLRASEVLDWLYSLAERLDRKIMVRLVKGAYWDTEIKLSQVEGHNHFPVFTRKASTDVSYMCCAEKLLAMTDRIYPQFATHNAHTVAAILEMAEDRSAFEFQRLHGMGEALHNTVLRRQGTRCRIYAPVGAHKDLLAYLVRRLLENGANSSFVNQIVDEEVPPEVVAGDPFEEVEQIQGELENPLIRQPKDLFAPQRENSQGWDLTDAKTLDALEIGIRRFDGHKWEAKKLGGEEVVVRSPANGEDVGTLYFASEDDVREAAENIRSWDDTTPANRAEILRTVADLYQQNAVEIFALLMREAGKTLLDCVGELREAVDVLRYYAAQCEKLDAEPVGVFTCISPWNFPLAIFTGQICAALAAGNGVLAKPAETTGLIADFAISLFKEAGVPENVLYLLPGPGREIGHLLTSHEKVGGVCFTGSTATAQNINRNMAAHLSPQAPLIAETGGLNAMIVDSTALPEQAVVDVLASAFQSAGQRCSALRVLYLQEDVAEDFQQMLFGAMDELIVGNPRDFSTDVGPIIDLASAERIHNHIEQAKADGRLLKQISAPEERIFVPPTAIRVNGIEDLAEEIFGPVLHIATYKAEDIDKVIEAINGKGFGLTFGLHTRIDDRVQHIVDMVEAGNIYINRNQIGAVVGSQPFGGEGLSGTGPKAGGPRYLNRFVKNTSGNDGQQVEPLELPGPTGESNQYSTVPRGRVLCLGPTEDMISEQIRLVEKQGCEAVTGESQLSDGEFEVVVSWADDVGETRNLLASRSGPIIPLLTGSDFDYWLINERHICINTTAAGGNAALLGGEGH
ncbi:MAG: bifunctional proline dehydrogenase/L-glutamate gamma-semialdehyde dehydrogenase PutA, partial [Pseudomonadota bacterium]